LPEEENLGITEKRGIIVWSSISDTNGIYEITANDFCFQENEQPSNKHIFWLWWILFKNWRTIY